MTSSAQSLTESKARDNYHVEEAVLDRYKQGARAVQPALCCPITNYDGQYLKVLPAEILEKDYGCGDPSQYVYEGDTVVDLGSGAGKICYILSQKVGAKGRVIGVDFNDEMLDLAKQYQADIAAKIGHDNVTFKKGRIQDLALDLSELEAWLAKKPVANIDDVMAYEAKCDQLKKKTPMIASGSVTAVVSNCVLNLVRTDQKKQLFNEIYRVLANGGRAVISDIVCDEAPIPEILADPDLWSGCIAGAFQEDEFLQMFEEAGFYGIEILARAKEPWQTIHGVEFRSMTVRAYKGKDGPCLERQQAVVYNGPWKKVVDDDGHTLIRGQRMAVCDKTYHIYADARGPYHTDITLIEPHDLIALEDAKPMPCNGAKQRSPRETKGRNYNMTTEQSDACCSDGESCC